MVRAPISASASSTMVTHRVWKVNGLLCLNRLLADGGEIRGLAHVGGEPALKADSCVVDGLRMGGHEAAAISGRRGVAAGSLSCGCRDRGVARSEFVEAAGEGVVVGHAVFLMH